jgi:phosphoglucomutase/phosphomannomutase
MEPWLKEPFDQKTQKEVQNLLQSDPQKIEDAFYSDLSFGTAGLRGLMGVGTNRMNIYTVRKTTQGLATYLQEVFPSQPISVCIGFDNRIQSQEFAQEAAQVLSHYGISVYLLKELRPTPYVSFACRHFHSQAAIMITASHNPKEYNGYKVYWQDGAQILSPHDQNILAHIKAIDGFSSPLKSNPDLIHVIDETLDNSYLDAIRPLAHYPKENHKYGNELQIVYTSLHGTGITLAPKALQDWGFSSISLVEKQVLIDGNFPTVAFPNPEYPEALKLGIDLLLQTKGDLLLASDPDADRLGVVVRHQEKAKTLTGNEIASLCIEYLCRFMKENNAFPPRPAMVTSVVSSRLMDAICDSYQVSCIRVLTGFKYIGEKIRNWEHDQAHTFLFGAEESYGFLLGTHSRDKDAIVSSCLIAEMALFFKRKGKTLVDVLYEIYQTYGIFRDSQRSIDFEPSKEGTLAMQNLMSQLRNSPPSQIHGKKVLFFEDYQKGIHNLPPSDMLLLKLENEIQLIIRPSGTEPKIKVYGEIRRPYQKDLIEEIEKTDLTIKTFLREFQTNAFS